MKTEALFSRNDMNSYRTIKCHTRQDPPFVVIAEAVSCFRELTIRKARRVAIGPLKVKRTVLVDVSLKRSRYHITTGNFATDISPIDDCSKLNYNVIRQQRCHAGGTPVCRTLNTILLASGFSRRYLMQIKEIIKVNQCELVSFILASLKAGGCLVCQ